MECQKCKSLLEIFAHNGKEIYVCPECMSALLPDESCLEALEQFSKEEIARSMPAQFMNDTLSGSTKELLKAEDNFACPQCKSYMRQYDFNKKTRFFVNKCVRCTALLIKVVQIPFVLKSLRRG